MEIFQRKTAAILLVAFSATCIFAKSKKKKNESSPPNVAPKIERQKPPEWMGDAGRLSLFPNEEFISALGIGFSVDNAKANAARGISSFIKTQVSSYTQAHYSESEKNGAVSEEKTLNETTTLSSNETLYTLDFTEAWRDEKTSQYFCVAFIDKTESWKQIEPKLSSIAADIANKFESANNDKSGFWRTLIFGKIISEKEKFRSLCNFANLVNPQGTKKYNFVKSKFLEAESAIQNERARQTIWLSVENDKNGAIYRELAAAFEKAGFTVSQSRGKFVAIAKVALEIREEGTAFVSRPGITLEVKNAFGAQVASFSHTAKKTVGFEKFALEEKAYRALGAEVDNMILGNEL